MSWIWSTVKTVHLLVLLLVCGIGFYNLNVTSEKSPPPEDKKGDNFGALTVVQDSEQQEQDDGVVIVESEDEIKIENPDPFIPTNEWQVVKPDSSPGLVDKLDLDEVKRAVKSMKSEEFKSVDMETLRKENQFRSYEELKADMEKINADIQTDAELISNLVQQFQALVEAKEDVTPILEQLEYYLHQIDNAMLFCDLGAMPTLLRCLNSSREKVRAEAALALGSALQSNPKVQIAAIENGAMHEVLRLVAFDQSMTVRKRAMYALSTMVRHFPFAQKHFLKLGGLSVLGKLFENKLTEKLQVRAVTLLADLIKEKELHSVHSDAADSAQEERLRQYGEINLQEAMVESGWCSLISSLLVIPEHDSREKVLVAMDTVLPACEMFFQSSVPMLRNLQEEYKELVREEQEESRDGEVEGDGFYQSLVGRVERLIDMLNIKEEL
ncbi:nucleotide exchange factor SIL1-like isoform X2 [Babylonia areolata]|uniref:nucleotide exchange factor SIL1-like isoform X2 n=1 Tax=Babylonia areolata TaxID=304850 RepID=UPI003FD6AF20